MTCIVGLVEGKRVIIGGDSAGVTGLDITLRKDEKVFRNGKFIIGCTSSFRMIQLLRFSLKPPKRPKGMDIYEYMCIPFIDEVKRCYKEKGYLQKFKDGDDKGGTFLVGYKGRLFIVDSDFQVGEAYIGYDAIGCGDSYAKGSLFATERLMTGHERVTAALRAAANFSGGVSPPFVLETMPPIASIDKGSEKRKQQ
jgi:ATP-dependent protease HslVU (ClpYQ) peptidase subunit